LESVRGRGLGLPWRRGRVESSRNRGIEKRRWKEVDVGIMTRKTVVVGESGAKETRDREDLREEIDDL
jgi:hypothetical protein